MRVTTFIMHVLILRYGSYANGVHQAKLGVKHFVLSRHLHPNQYSCIRLAKALANLRMYDDSPESLLLTNTTGTFFCELFHAKQK